MATPKKNTKSNTYKPVPKELPITDKRSKAYRDYKNAHKSIKKTVSKPIGHTLSTHEYNDRVDPAQIGTGTSNTVDIQWTIHSLIDSISNAITEVNIMNGRLYSIVDKVVFIEREPTPAYDTTKRSDSVTDRLDYLNWGIRQITDTYNRELSILERYIGNTNKA